MGWDFSEGYWLTRLCLQRAVAFLYVIGFLILLNQFRPLAGERGLVPVGRFLANVPFSDAPSLFHLAHSDRLFQLFSWLGLVLAGLALFGVPDRFGLLSYLPIWVALWVIYLSFVNIGQVFYGYGWEILLLEMGFLTIFLGPKQATPPVIVIWLMRWLLFRLMFGAGMIKIRGDECWRDLTCMYYHYETQPLPNPLSWYFHHLPKPIHKLEVLFTHFVELIVPWFYFVPGRVGWIAGILTFFFQVTLILSGNLSWLNYATLVLAIACFDDRLLSKIFSIVPETVLSSPLAYRISVYGLGLLVLFLSYRPARNLFSRGQLMNASFDSLHLVNTYGAFGSITRTRREVVVEGTDEEHPTEATQWKEYEFKGKPGAVSRAPCIVSPYHYKLDWQMWFAAMSSYPQHPWILNLAARLLEGDKPTLALMAHNPFPDKPPRFIRMEWYEYHFTPPGDKSGNWWSRTHVDSYLPPLSLDNPNFQAVLKRLNES